MTIFELIPYLSTFSPLVPMAFGFRKRTSLLWLYAMAGFISDMLMVVVMEPVPERAVVANAFIIAEFLFIYSYYRRQFQYSFNTVFIFSLLLFGIGSFTMFYIPGKGVSFAHAINGFNWLGAVLFCFTYIIFTMCGFLYIIRRQTTLHLERSSFFIINVAFILYASTVFLVLLFSQYLLTRQQISLFWRFVEVMNIVKYLLLARALTLKKP